MKKQFIAPKWGYLLVSVLFLSGCTLDVSITSSNLPDLPPISVPTSPLQFTNVLENQNLIADENLDIEGNCSPNLSIDITGTALQAPFSGVCDSSGRFQVSLPIVSIPTNEGSLSITQILNGEILTTEIHVNVKVKAVCGNIQIYQCAEGGDGSASTPYLMGNDISCLQKMNLGLSCHYKLIENIDASATSTWNSGQGWLPVGTPADPFTGFIDGDNHSISDLYINRTSSLPYEGTGFFGNIDGNYNNDNNISNIKLENVNIFSTGLNSSYSAVGALAGRAQYININNVEISGSIGGGNIVGALFGSAESTNITNTHVRANVALEGTEIIPTALALLDTPIEVAIQESAL